MSVALQIVCWRDIPAQVKAKAGRQRASVQLSERFQEAIDAAAMRAGLSGTDQYLAEWRTEEAGQRDGEPEAAAGALAAELEAAYPDDRLQQLIAGRGKAA